jgi:hypothetical protein
MDKRSTPLYTYQYKLVCCTNWGKRNNSNANAIF